MTAIYILLTAISAFSQPCTSIVAPQLSENTRKNFEQKLAEARSQYEKDSNNADALIWYGRRTAYLGKYMEAIGIYSKGISLHPEDARMYRHRGHRYITVRCFDKAVADFETAAVLTEGKPDETEPDGIPNEKNIPVSTLKTNIWYHLGLALFLKGEYDQAAQAYKRGVAASKKDDMLVAMINWLNVSLLSQDKKEEAENFSVLVPRTPNLIENGDYLTLLYFYVHKPSIDEIERYTNTVIAAATNGDTTSVGAATLFFGAGYYCKLNGMPEKAKLFLGKAVATEQWSSFGYIAAEAELKRMKE